MAWMVSPLLIALLLFPSAPVLAEGTTRDVSTLIEACLGEAASGHTLGHKNPPNYLIDRHRIRMREICKAWKTVKPGDVSSLQADCEKEASRFADRYSFDIFRVRKHAQRQREICKELGSGPVPMLATGGTNDARF